MPPFGFGSPMTVLRCHGAATGACGVWRVACCVWCVVCCCVAVLCVSRGSFSARSRSVQSHMGEGTRQMVGLGRQGTLPAWERRARRAVLRLLRRPGQVPAPDTTVAQAGGSRWTASQSLPPSTVVREGSILCWRSEFHAQSLCVAFVSAWPFLLCLTEGAFSASQSICCRALSVDGAHVNCPALEASRSRHHDVHAGFFHCSVLNFLV